MDDTQTQYCSQCHKHLPLSEFSTGKKTCNIHKTEEARQKQRQRTKESKLKRKALVDDATLWCNVCKVRRPIDRFRVKPDGTRYKLCEKHSSKHEEKILHDPHFLPLLGPPPAEQAPNAQATETVPPIDQRSDLTRRLDEIWAIHGDAIHAKSSLRAQSLSLSQRLSHSYAKEILEYLSQKQ